MNLLIANFKYVGEDYEKDMANVANDQETQRWWKLTDGMQESFVDGATGSGGDVSWWKVRTTIDIHTWMIEAFMLTYISGAGGGLPVRGEIK